MKTIKKLVLATVASSLIMGSILYATTADAVYQGRVIFRSQGMKTSAPVFTDKAGRPYYVKTLANGSKKRVYVNFRAKKAVAPAPVAVPASP